MKYVLLNTKLINGKYWTSWRSTGSNIKYFLAPSTVDPNSIFDDEKVRNFEKWYKVDSTILFAKDFI